MGLADVGIMSFGFGLEMSHAQSGSTSASDRTTTSTPAWKADIGPTAQKRTRRTAARGGKWSLDRYSDLMKFGELKSIGHNIADSLGSGICLLVGYYETDIFAEASGSPAGYIEVDFLTGTSSGSPTSPTLTKVIKLYQDALDRLCASHGANTSAFAALTARFATDSRYGSHFTVTVEDQRGRRSIDGYLGTPGRKLKVR